MSIAACRSTACASRSSKDPRTSSPGRTVSPSGTPTSPGGAHLGLPEIQDAFVLPEHRRCGIATQLAYAAEKEARVRGWDRISPSVSQEATLPPGSCTNSSGTSMRVLTPFVFPERSVSEAGPSRWTTHSSVSRSFSERSARDFGQLQSGIGLSRCW
ncbi:MAG: GNAT family N-acetyltransferase [Actinobacteria bacterium]|nr:MAG: GNAT family N-acetyltransferase [Actinomycetota bacterium]